MLRSTWGRLSSKGVDSRELTYSAFKARSSGWASGCKRNLALKLDDNGSDVRHPPLPGHRDPVVAINDKVDLSNLVNRDRWEVPTTGKGSLDA